MRRPAMQVAQKQARRNYKLQILGVSIGLRHRGMVIEHQRNAGGDQDEKCSKGQRAQIPGRAEAEHPGPHLGRKEMQEHVLLYGERSMQGARSRPTAEHRAPDSRAAQLVEIVRDCFRHAYTFLNVMGSTCLERSTIKSPSSLSETSSQGSGLGAGPSIFAPGILLASKT